MAKTETSPPPTITTAIFTLVKSFSEGSAGSLAGKGLTAPADRLKILIQTQHPDFLKTRLFAKSPNGFIAAFTNIIKIDGFTGLYRSNSIALCRHGLHGGLGFTVYDKLKTKSANYYQTSQNHNKQVQKYIIPVLIGATCGVSATLVTFPLDTFRVILATQAGTYKENYRRLGPNKIGRLYSGLSPAVIGVIPYAGLNFGITDILRDYVTRTEILANLCLNSNGRMNWLGSFVTGWVAGSLTQAMTYPIEVIKRRKQHLGNDVSIKQVIKAITNEKQVISQLYRGFSLNIIRHPICNGIVWLVRDMVKNYNLGR